MHPRRVSVEKAVRIVRGQPKQIAPGRALLRRWRFLLACGAIATILTGVALLARPPVYEAYAAVQYDPQRYTAEPQQVAQEAYRLVALRFPADLQGSAQIPQPLELLRSGPTRWTSIGRATSGEQARQIATHGAEAAAEALRTLYGWDLLRLLLRRAIYLQGQGQAEAPTLLTPHLFEMLDAGILPYDPTLAVSAAAPLLRAQDVADITLAVQHTENRLTADLMAHHEERARLQDPSRQAALEAEIAAINRQLATVRPALLALYRQGSELVEEEGGGTDPIFQEANLPAGPTGLPRWPFLFVGVASGLLFGAVMALLDEAVELGPRLREIVAYRDLLWNLVVRDLKARYKSSVLGYLWSLVNPLLLMVVFTVLFKVFLKSPIPNFPVFIIVGLLPWNFCTTSVSGAVVSITGQSALIKKVYFPREIIPISLVIANLINYLLALPAMVGLMLVLNAHFQFSVVLFPLIVLIQAIFLLGLAFFLSALNVFFRDTQVIMEVLLTAWFFLTPIFYRLGDIVDERWARLVRWVNPMASLVDFYRDIFYLGGMPGWDAIVRTLATALLVLVAGYLFFVRLSPRFGEEV